MRVYREAHGSIVTIDSDSFGVPLLAFMGVFTRSETQQRVRTTALPEHK